MYHLLYFGITVAILIGVMYFREYLQRKSQEEQNDKSAYYLSILIGCLYERQGMQVKGIDLDEITIDEVATLIRELGLDIIVKQDGESILDTREDSTDEIDEFKRDDFID